MKPEQQRIAIAEWCGLTPDKRYAGCPDYLNDLNAMHEAESRLVERLATDYVLRLEKLHSAFPVGINVSCVISWILVHATAAQRAEALLHTIGKWKD